MDDSDDDIDDIKRHIININSTSINIVALDEREDFDFEVVQTKIEENDYDPNNITIIMLDNLNLNNIGPQIANFANVQSL